MRPLLPPVQAGRKENKPLKSPKPDRRPPDETIEEHWRRASLAVKWRSVPGNVRGGIWMLLATLFFSIMVAMIKLAGQTLHVTEILLVRQITMLVITAPMIMSAFPRSLHSQRPGLQSIRIVIAFFSMVLGFTAIIHLPLAEATAISFGKTFFATILAIVILGEVVGPRRWGAVITGFIGVLIVAWPSGEGAFNIYGLLAIISAGCVACVMIIVRKLSQIDMPITILSYQAIGVGILMVPPAIWFWKTPTLNELLLLIAIGGFSVIGQYCNIQSGTWEPTMDFRLQQWSPNHGRALRHSTPSRGNHARIEDWRPTEETRGFTSAGNDSTVHIPRVHRRRCLAGEQKPRPNRLREHLEIGTRATDGKIRVRS